ncbi:MAG: HTH domain-containing protein [Patescibacteria group bacterium]
MNIHPLQEKIYQLFKENKNNLPSYREIAKLIGVSSTNTVSHHIKQLKKKGYFGIGNAINDIIPFNLKILLDFENKPGVYVFLKNKTPLYVGAAENIKKDLIEIIAGNSAILNKIKENSDNIYIAYYLIEDGGKREKVKSELLEHYSQRGVAIFTTSQIVN